MEVESWLASAMRNAGLAVEQDASKRTDQSAQPWNVYGRAQRAREPSAPEPQDQPSRADTAAELLPINGLRIETPPETYLLNGPRDPFEHGGSRYPSGVPSYGESSDGSRGNQKR